MNKANQLHAIIDGRNTGKTTWLYQLISSCFGKMPIMVIDSATEHEEKSLLIRLKKQYPSCWIPSPGVGSIIGCSRLLTENVSSFYPCSLLPERSDELISHLFLVDAAKYLEYGYDTEDLSLRNERRLLYKRFSEQAVLAFLSKLRDSKQTALLVMDEIELEHSFRMLLPMLQSQACNVWVSLHDDSGLRDLIPFFLCYHMNHYIPELIQE